MASKVVSKQHALPLVFGLASGLSFMIFTVGLLSASFRSLVLGIYTVEELKGIKHPGLSNSELRMLWLSWEGRRKLCIFMDKLGSDFKSNWKRMVGADITFKDIVLVI